MRRRCINGSSLQHLAFITETTASLSDLTRTCCPAHLFPHTVQAAMTGTISFIAMDSDNTSILSHAICSQKSPQNAPHPHEPEASEITVMPASLKARVESIDVPFHLSMNNFHHARSDLNALLRRIGLFGHRADLSSSIILLRNDLPGLTTVLAWCSWPIKNSSSLFSQCLRESHWSISCFSRSNFSVGRRISILRVSIRMPRNVRIGAGPSIL